MAYVTLQSHQTILSTWRSPPRLLLTTGPTGGSCLVEILTNNSDFIDRPRSELTELELQQLEEFEFAHGPMSLLQHAVSTNTPVVISCRNNHKLVAKVKAFDRHCNMVLESVKELWSEPVRNAKGKVIKTVSRERFVSKMFLRGDSVVIVVKT